MFMALHLFKRDLRHTWWLYLVWLALYVVEAFLALAFPPSINGSWITGGARQMVLFPALHLLILAILVPQLIHEDPVVGSAGFWLTRPISRMALVVSKFMGLLLLGLIPAAVNLVAFTQLGLTAASIVKAGCATFAYQGLFILPIAVAAALTPTFRWYGAVLARLAVAAGLFLIITSSGLGISPPADPYAAAAVSEARAAINQALVLVGCSLILFYQYRTRRTRYSWRLVLCLAASYTLIACFWPWTLGLIPSARPLPTSFDPSSQAFSAQATSLNGAVTPFSSHRHIDGVYSLSNLPSAFYLQVRESEGRLTLPDGSVIESTTALSTDPFHGISSPTDYSAISNALDGIPVYRYLLGVSGATLAEINDKVFQKIKATSAKLTTRFDFIAGHYQIAAEVPLARGQTFDAEGTHVCIQEIHSEPIGVRLVLLKSTVRASWALAMQPGTATYEPRSNGDLTYLLLNRKKREAVIIDGDGRPWSSSSQFYLSGMLVEEQTELPFGEGTGPNAPVVNEPWLAKATLVCLERVPTSEFSETAQFNFARLDMPWAEASNHRIH